MTKNICWTCFNKSEIVDSLCISCTKIKKENMKKEEKFNAVDRARGLVEMGASSVNIDVVKDLLEYFKPLQNGPFYNFHYRGIVPNTYVANNLWASLNLVNDTGDWYNMVKRWCKEVTEQIEPMPNWGLKPKCEQQYQEKIKELEDKIQELEEYKWKYKDLMD